MVAQPWWFKLARWLTPSRCREIPHPNGRGVLLRQVALVRQSIYLQGFADAEDPRWLHSHQWRWMLCVGLWGGYTEHRMNGPARRRRAPYLFTMGADTIHRIDAPAPGHTSILVGLGRDERLRHYYASPVTMRSGNQDPIQTTRRHWTHHVQKVVTRL